jgi:DNA-binding transcriptional MerR regulator
MSCHRVAKICFPIIAKTLDSAPGAGRILPNVDSNNPSHPSPKCDPTDRLLTIGAFSAASRLSQKALRLYDRHGLLRPAYTDPESGYRYYRTAQLRTAKLILLMRQVNMPLAKIQRLLVSTSGEASYMAQVYWRGVEAEIQRNRRTLEELLCCLQESPNEEAESMNTETAIMVTTRDLAPQLVLSISKRVKIDGLEEHIRETPKRLIAFADAQPSGEIMGQAFGIYHGPVNRDDDGPMEVCLPVKGAFTPSGDLVLRELPGGPAVCVAGGGEYCEFPKVLELYDAACDWMQKNGSAQDGPPREMWSGPNGEDHVIEVVWPYRKGDA